MANNNKNYNNNYKKKKKNKSEQNHYNNYPKINEKSYQKNKNDLNNYHQNGRPKRNNYKKCVKCENYSFYNFPFCKNCLIKKIEYNSINQYIYCIKYHCKFNLSKICIDNNLFEIDNNIFPILGLSNFKNIKDYELYIKSKICAGCCKTFKDQKDILKFKCGCHYCLSCQKRYYKKTKSKCYKCSY